MRSYINLDVDVDIEIDEFVNHLSVDQKKYLLDELVNELGQQQAILNPMTTTEAELQRALADIWESRHLLTRSQIQRVVAITNESYVG